MHFGSGLVQVTVAALMLAYPAANIVVLTAMIATAMVLEGCLRIASAIVSRPGQGWGWLLASGLLTTVVAVAIINLAMSDRRPRPSPRVLSA